jgi:hypothetical protein
VQEGRRGQEGRKAGRLAGWKGDCIARTTLTVLLSVSSAGPGLVFRSFRELD